MRLNSQFKQKTRQRRQPLGDQAGHEAAFHAEVAEQGRRRIEPQEAPPSRRFNLGLPGRGRIFRFDKADEFSDREYPGKFVVFDLEVEPAFQGGQQFHQTQGVQAQVQLQMVVQGDAGVLDLAGQDRHHGLAHRGEPFFHGRLFLFIPFAGPLLVNPLGFIDFDLPQPGFGQLLVDEDEILDPFIRLQTPGPQFQFPLHLGVDVRFADFPKEVQVRHHHRGQFLGVAVSGDKNLFDGRSLEIVLAHLLAGDVLARGQDDDVLDAALDVEIAVPVEIAQIAAVKPAVFEDFPGGGLIVEIPGHDVVAPDEDFADAVGVGVKNSDFHPGKGPARRPRAGSCRRVEGNHRCGLRQAVAFQHRKSQLAPGSLPGTRAAWPRR